ncbi:MAG: sigma-54-dependent transcriptional regulator [Planctomycetota bacterium]
MTLTKSTPDHVLIVDDQEYTLESARAVMESVGYEVATLSDPTKALQLLHDFREGPNPIDLVITDLDMPRLNGEELTAQISSTFKDLPIIVYTGDDERASKKRLLEAGAWDYLEKQGSVEDLLCTIDKVWAQVLRRKTEGEKTTPKLIFRDEVMKEVIGTIRKLAPIPSPVLIQGEPGTGKELVAHEIHLQRMIHLSDQVNERVNQKDYPYLAVNCGALSRTLLESQLFGHKKGAFTGSVADQDGLFVAAGKGTLFLDEITELDMDLQVKLLRALQEKEVTPVGSNRPVPFHARVITATNRPIQELVQQGKFREDLFYRINVINLDIPPLRDRRDDIVPIAKHFIDKLHQEYQLPGERTLTPEAEKVLQEYHWPGNVRELNNCIERSFALAGHPELIRVADLPPEVVGLQGFAESCETAGRAVVERAVAVAASDHFQTYDEVVADHIRKALSRSKGVKSRAASLLSIDRNRLYRLMEKYEI